MLNYNLIKRQRGERGERDRGANQSMGRGETKERTFTSLSSIFLITFMCINIHNVQAISVSDIQGFDLINIYDDHRVEIQQRQRQNGLGVALEVNNVQQCAKACWQYSSCIAVTYSPHKSQPFCRLTLGGHGTSLTLVEDPGAVVLDMTDALVKKERLYGCDKRPCNPDQLCVTRRNLDTFSCLSLASTICGEPSVHIDNATLSTDGVNYAHYRCNDGFVSTPNGVVTSECDKTTGQWSDVSLSCRFVDCGPSSPMDRATVRYTETHYGSTSKYRCDDGHFSPSEGDMDTVCQESGHWSSTPSPCSLIECGQPAPLDNAQVSLPFLIDEHGNPTNSSEDDTRTFYGGVATHSCLEGYTSSTLSFRSTCQQDGQWSKPTDSFQCRPVDCGNPMAIDHAITIYNSTTYLSNITYSCVDGYHSPSTPDEESTAISKCQQNGTWSGIFLTCILLDCGTPPHFPGILVSANSTNPGSIASLTCSNTSQQLMGIDRLTCNTSGLWSELNASCSAEPCATPISVANSTVTVQMDDDDYVAIYQSMPGYVFNTGNASMTFLCIGGSWKDFPDDLHSLPVDCNSPPQIANTHVMASYHTFNSVATYSCHTGFRNTTTSNQISCLENGKWSQVEMECSKIVCGNSPPFVEHSRNNMNFSMEYVYGDKIVYECEDGFSLKNSNETASCKELGWEMSDIECVRNECGPPPNVINSTFVIQGGEVLYSCNEGFALMHASVSKKTCSGTGWSEEDVGCVPNLCPDPPPVEKATPSFNSTTRGSVVRYECTDGFGMGNTSVSERVCQDNLEWSDEDIICVPLGCGTPPSVSNTRIIYSWDEDALTVEYYCKEGFTIPPHASSSLILVEDSSVGRSLRPVRSVTDNIRAPTPIWTTSCEVSGSWNSDGVKPEGCAAVDCGEPPDVANATSPLTSSTTFGSSVFYQCVDGFQLQIESLGVDNDVLDVKVCGESGQWEGDVECVPINNCGDPPVIPHAQIWDQSLFVSRYKCDKGYHTTSSLQNSHIFEITCLQDLNWSPGEACVPIDCQEPLFVAHATAHYVETTFNHEVKYVCDDGFSVKTVDGIQETNCSTIQCLQNGTWSVSAFKCVKLCPYPENVTKEMYVQGRNPGDAIIYTCENGKEHRWFDRKTCLENGSWSEVNIQCSEVDCGTPRSIENGNLTYNSTTLGSVAKYDCNPSYKMMAKQGNVRASAICLEDSRWSEYFKECVLKGEVICPTNTDVMKLIRGKTIVSSITNGGSITYTCAMGSYLLTNSSNMQIAAADNVSIICKDGQWMGEIPTCERIDCGSPPEITNGVIKNLKTTHYRSKVVYDCADSYVHPGPDRKLCEATGNWSSDVVECVHRDSVYCQPPETRMNMEVHYESHIVGSEAAYTCTEGYINGSVKMKCLNSGEWSRFEDIECVPVDCQSPPEMNNTVMHVHATTFGQHAIYTCSLYSQDEDHRPSRSQCQANGTWSRVKSPCFHCSTPPQHPNTADQSRIKHLYNIGEIVRYDCKDGYARFPANTKVQVACGEGGMWSQGQTGSKCVPLTCLNMKVGMNTTNISTRHFSNDGTKLLTHYDCLEGHHIEGNDETVTRGIATCDFETGWLSDEILDCIPVDCGPAPRIDKASVLENGTKYPAEITYECDPTYLAKGSVLTSVCGPNGAWSSVDLTCVQCSLGDDIAKGRLVEFHKDFGSDDQQSLQEATVFCNDKYLLYRKNGSVQSPMVITCEMGADGKPYWDPLSDLTCSKRVWSQPDKREAIRLDDSYSSYNVCLAIRIGWNFPLSISLNAFKEGPDGEEQTAVALGLVIIKAAGRVDVVQSDYSGNNHLDTFSHTFPYTTTRKSNVVCIEAFSETSEFYVWIDGEFVGGPTNAFKIPLSEIYEVAVAGSNFIMEQITITV